jgi:hypothetical protein
MNSIEIILSRLEGVEQYGDKWKARCPAHNDRNPSLSLTVGDNGSPLIKCWAGCHTDDVLKAIELCLGLARNAQGASHESN